MTDILKHFVNRSLAHVVRFNAMPQHFSESVAEHSFYVAYIAHILCGLLKEKGVQIDKEKVVTMALVHDMEEMYSGDILSPFKHHSDEVRDAIRKVNKELIKDVFEDLPEGLQKDSMDLWIEENAQESLEAQVVKMADNLSLVGKCQEEIQAGNSFFKEVHDRQMKRLRADEREWWMKIKADVLG